MVRQIQEINGSKGPDKFLPHLLGHEGCGEVLEIGPGVKTVNVGDRVCLHWRKGSGIQSDPPKYKWRGQVLNAGWITTFNNYAVISENRCTKIPNKTNRDHASLFGCAITTGFGVVENNAKLKMGESVVVFGAGGIGLSIIQAASMVSGYPIIAVDIHQKRLDLAQSLGATHIINNKDSKAFEIQKNSGLLTCPYCGGMNVIKSLMSPSIQTSKSSKKNKFKEDSYNQNLISEKNIKDNNINMNVNLNEAVTVLRSLKKEIQKKADFVGDKFAEEAKAINDGEAKERPIYGNAKSDEIEQLKEEGIEVATIPWIQDDH